MQRESIDVPATETLEIDLVLPTVGRVAETARFLDSLAAQSYRSFRLVVVDQNPDDRVLPLIRKHEASFPLVHRRAPLGLSHARNVGLQEVRGDVVGFPDDDCWYPPDLLSEVARMMSRDSDLGGVGGRTTDPRGGSPLLLWASTDRPLPITRGNVWRTAVAATIFLRRAVVESVGDFDQSLGVGAGTPWGSGEETDYLLRALEAGWNLRYEPRLSVFHPSPSPAFSLAAARRGYSYGMGNSRVLRKHGYSWRFAVYRVLQLVAGSSFYLATGRPARARFYWAMARGRAVGWIRGAT